MAESLKTAEQSNCETFRDCLSEPVLKALATPIEPAKPKKKRHSKKSSKENNTPIQPARVRTITNNNIQADAEDLGEFIEVLSLFCTWSYNILSVLQYLTSVLFPCLPSELQGLTYPKYKDSNHLQDKYSTPLSASTYTHLLNLISPDSIDSLESYALLPQNSDQTDQHHFFTPLFTAYISAVTAPPPIWSTTRTTACELCERDWVPLTYHHLIPRSTHDRVMKRGWHTEDKLNSVAWLCRACHSFVHRLASNEELARSYFAMELILDGGVEEDPDKRAEVEGWVKWVSSVRWRSR